MCSHARITVTLAATLLACGGGGGGDGPTASNQRLAAVGRLERGVTVRLVARDGASAADSVVANVTVTPAGAATVSGSSLKLLQSGSITVSAMASDGRTLTTVLDVAVPPTVYFDGVVSANRDVYSAALDGGDRKRLTTAAGDDGEPTVAAGMLAFTSWRDGNAELYTIALASGAETRLTTTTANEREPSLAKSAATIAFVGDVSGTPRVLVAPTSLAGPQRLTPTGSLSGVAVEAHPTWSPSADRIAFVSTASGPANLFIGSAAALGTVPTRVAGWVAGQTDAEPAWSLDGDFLAFASTRAGGLQIFLLDLRTGSYRQLTSGASSAGQPTWLADGRVVFTLIGGSTTSLWWMDPSTSEGPVEVATAGLTAVGHPAGVR